MGNLISPVDSIPSNTSTSQEWINWYDSLKKRYGAKSSGVVWLEAWNKNGSYSANDSSFRNQLSKRGIDVDGDVWFLSDLADEGESFLDLVSGGAKILGSLYLISMVVGIALVAFILYKLAKNPESTAKMATLIATKAATKGIV